ncbi:unnamed protein product, partial [Symbiodinium natans]
MVSHADLPAHIVTMLQQHCPFVFTHQYTIDPSPHRFLDLLEIFAGAGRLSKSADAVSGLEWFAVVSLLLLIMMFSPTPYLRRKPMQLAGSDEFMLQFLERATQRLAVRGDDGRAWRGKAGVMKDLDHRVQQVDVVDLLTQTGRRHVPAVHRITVPPGPPAVAPVAAVPMVIDITSDDDGDFEMVDAEPRQCRPSLPGDAESKGKDKKDKKAEQKKRKKRKTTSESESADEEVHEVDRQSFFKITPKDMQRGQGQNKLEDLGMKQLAYCTCSLYDFVLPSDIIEVGGECEALLLESAQRFKRQKDKANESATVHKAKAAANLWRKRQLGHSKEKLMKSYDQLMVELKKDDPVVFCSFLLSTSQQQTLAIRAMSSSSQQELVDAIVAGVGRLVAPTAWEVEMREREVIRRETQLEELEQELKDRRNVWLSMTSIVVIWMMVRLLCTITLATSAMSSGGLCLLGVANMDSLTTPPALTPEFLQLLNRALTQPPPAVPPPPSVLPPMMPPSMLQAWEQNRLQRLENQQSQFALAAAQQLLQASSTQGPANPAQQVAAAPTPLMTQSTQQAGQPTQPTQNPQPTPPTQPVQAAAEGAKTPCKDRCPEEGGRAKEASTAAPGKTLRRVGHFDMDSGVVELFARFIPREEIEKNLKAKRRNQDDEDRARSTRKRSPEPDSSADRGRDKHRRREDDSPRRERKKPEEREEEPVVIAEEEAVETAPGREADVDVKQLASVKEPAKDSELATPKKQRKPKAKSAGGMRRRRRRVTPRKIDFSEHKSDKNASDKEEEEHRSPSWPVDSGSQSDGGDDDLFKGQFARPLADKNRTSRKSAASSRKKQRRDKKEPDETENQESEESEVAKSQDGTVDDKGATYRGKEENRDAEEVTNLMGQIDDDLASILPAGASRSDLKLFINILIEEDITTLEDAVDLLSNIEGDILDHMGQNARLFANNLTLKGKRLLKQWPVLLKASDIRVLDGTQRSASTGHPELSGLGPEWRTEDAGEKQKLKEAFDVRVVYFDDRILTGSVVRLASGDVPLPTPEALLNKYRAQAARAGLLIRPNLNIKLGVKESEREEAEAERKENMTMQMSESWAIDFELHIPRKCGYKGSQVKVNEQAVRLSCDAVTNLGALFMAFRLLLAVSVLQVKGCKNNLKKGTQSVLDLMIANACHVRFREHHVDLVDWEDCLTYLGWWQRWKRNKNLSHQQRSLTAGVKLSVVVFFVMRMGFEELCAEDIPVGRVQKRLLHTLAQHMETNMNDKLLDELPVLSGMKFKSINVLCDTSPKGRMDEFELQAVELFVPIIAVDETVVCWVLQKMSDLNASTAATDVKLEELQKVTDHISAKMIEKESVKTTTSKLPKTLAKIRQQRIASKEQLRALMHVLSLCDVTLRMPEISLDAVNPAENERRDKYKGRPFITNLSTGQSRWISAMDGDDYNRLVLSPDEGGPLYTAWRFVRMHCLTQWAMRARKCPWNTHKMDSALKAHADDLLQQLYAEDILAENKIPYTDDMQLNFKNVVEILHKIFRKTGALHEYKRWCSWGLTARSFQYTGTLLAMLWSAMEEGRNPFTDPTPSTSQQSSQYERALLDDNARALYEAMQPLCDPFCDMTLALVDTNAKMMKKWDMMIAGHKKQVDYRFVKENFDQFLSSSSSDISPPVTPRIVENTPKRKREVIAKKWRCKIRSLYAQMCGPVRVEVDREMYNPALKPAKVLQVSASLCDTDDQLLTDYVNAWTTSLFELQMYSIYLRTCPAKLALLVLDPAEEPSVKIVQNKVLMECRKEWETILSLEENANLNGVLRQLCPHTRYRCLREPLTCLEQTDFVVTEDAKLMILAWYPKVAHSANVEGIFNSLEDTIKRSMKSNNPSLPNIQCSAIKAVNHKLCQGENAASSISLGPPDFEGNEIRCIRPSVFRPESYQGSNSPGSLFRMEDILKPFGSTSAFYHNKVNLNYLRGMDPVQCYQNFWVAGMVQRGMLLKMDGEWLLALGCTPALMYAVQLEELDLMFLGALPPVKTDERKIPNVETTSRRRDPLQNGEQVKALMVEVFDYTLHSACSRLTAKLDNTLLFRRSMSGHTLLTSLMRDKTILKVNSDVLTKLLDNCGVRIRRNSTKSAKIRGLMRLPEVTAFCRPEELEDLEKALEEHDKRRRKKRGGDNDDGDEDEEGEADAMNMEETDPAVELAQQMLQAMDDEEDIDEDPEKKPAEGQAETTILAEPENAGTANEASSSSQAPQAAVEERTRESRQTLSRSTAVPAWLYDHYDMPREVEEAKIDTRATSIELMTARDRSMLQAWYMLFCWSCEGLKNKRKGDTFSWPRYLNTVGLLVMFGYLAVCMALSRPIHCLSNPNGTQSMKSFPAMICWTDAHIISAVQSIFGLLVFGCGFLAYIIQVVWRYPTLVETGHGLKLLTQYHFLFNRFGSHAYYWGPYFISQKLFVAVVPIVFADSAIVQIMLLSLLMVIYLSSCCHVKPWATYLANLADVFLNIGLLLMLLIAAFLADSASLDSRSKLSVILVIMLVAIMSGIALLASFALSKKLFPGKMYDYFLCHHKAGAGTMCRWMKGEMLKQSHRVKVFLDSDELEGLADIGDIVKSQTGTLVIVATKLVLTRPWCAVEITSAVNNKIEIVMVELTTFSHYDEEGFATLREGWGNADIMIFAQNAINPGIVEECYRKLPSTTRIPFDPAGTLRTHQEAVAKILRLSIANAHKETEDEADIVILGAISSSEGRFTCQVLADMVIHRTTKHAVLVCSPEEAIHAGKTAKYMLVVLSGGILQDEAFLAMLEAVDTAFNQELEIVSAIADQSFEFPSAKYFQALVDNGSHVLEQSVLGRFVVWALKFRDLELVGGRGFVRVRMVSSFFFQRLDFESAIATFSGYIFPQAQQAVTAPVRQKEAVEEKTEAATLSLGCQAHDQGPRMFLAWKYLKEASRLRKEVCGVVVSDDVLTTNMCQLFGRSIAAKHLFPMARVDLAGGLRPALAGCVRELLLTVDTRKKTPGALRKELESDVGRELLASLRRAAATAAELLGTTWREVFIDYSDRTLIEEVLVRGLGLPSSVARRALPHLWKNAPMYLYMAHLSRTEYLLHFDSDVILDHIYPKSASSASQWFTAAGSYLQNSSALLGLWAVGFEDCSPYPKGTVDLLMPLLPQNRGGVKASEFDSFPGRCIDRATGKLQHVHQGDEAKDAAACQEMCRHGWMRCAGFEWHGKPSGGRCVHLWAKQLGHEPTASSNVTCFVGRKPRNPRDPHHRPRPRGAIYLRMQRYQMRGPLAMLRSLL